MKKPNPKPDLVNISKLDISNLKNLGPKSEAWLRTVGVETLLDLEERGALTCYHQLRARGFPATLNLVYSIEATLQGLDWRELPLAEKEKTREAIKKGGGKNL